MQSCASVAVGVATLSVVVSGGGLRGGTSDDTADGIEVERTGRRTQSCKPYYCVHQQNECDDRWQRWCVHGWTLKGGGKTIRTFPGRVLTDNNKCAEECHKDPECDTWTWHHSTGDCVLLEVDDFDAENAELCHADGVVSGPSGGHPYGNRNPYEFMQSKRQSGHCGASDSPAPKPKPKPVPTPAPKPNPVPPFPDPGCKPYYCVHEQNECDGSNNWCVHGWTLKQGGKTFKTFPGRELTNNNQCAEACHKDPNCVTWTWSHSTGDCELMEGAHFDAENAELCYASGVVSGPSGGHPYGNSDPYQFMNSKRQSGHCSGGGSGGQVAPVTSCEGEWRSIGGVHVHVQGDVAEFANGVRGKIDCTNDQEITLTNVFGSWTGTLGNNRITWFGDGPWTRVPESGCLPYYCVHEQNECDGSNNWCVHGWTLKADGKTIKTFPGRELTDNNKCAEECHKDPKCDTWTWHHSTGDCVLLDAWVDDFDAENAELCRADGVVSGPSGGHPYGSSDPYQFMQSKRQSGHC